MAYTALQAVNKILKRLQKIQGSAEELTSFTDSRIQHSIDVTLEYLNDAIHELYRVSGGPMPQQQAEQNITLATDAREYTFSPADVEEIDWPLLEETLGQYIFEYPGGYERMRRLQTQPSSYTGRPSRGAINPTNGKLRLDKIPTSTENGDVYVMSYKKRLSISAIADTFPMNDTVVDALVQVVVETYELKERNDFKGFLQVNSFGRAASYLNPSPPASHW